MSVDVLIGFEDLCPCCRREPRCRWRVSNFTCEGEFLEKTPLMPGFRVSVHPSDFNIPSWCFVVEKQRKGWFFRRWEEIEGSRSFNPDDAVRRAEYFLPHTRIRI